MENIDIKVIIEALIAKIVAFVKEIFAAEVPEFDA